MSIFKKIVVLAGLAFNVITGTITDLYQVGAEMRQVLNSLFPHVVVHVPCEACGKLNLPGSEQKGRRLGQMASMGEVSQRRVLK